jgi:hypothetical protein
MNDGVLTQERWNVWLRKVIVEEAVREGLSPLWTPTDLEEG